MVPLWERCLPAIKPTRTAWLTEVFLSRASALLCGMWALVGARLARDEGDADCLAHRGVLIASKLGSYRDPVPSGPPRYRLSRASAHLRGMWALVGARLARDEGDADCLAHRGVLIASKLGSYRDPVPSGPPRYRLSRASAHLRGMWALVGARLARDKGDVDFR